MRGFLIQVGAGVLAAGALLYTALNFPLAREGHVIEECAHLVGRMLRSKSERGVKRIQLIFRRQAGQALRPVDLWTIGG